MESPKPIKLTDAEHELLSQIQFDVIPHSDLERETYLAGCERSLELMQSLVERDAIPAERWEFFTDGEHNIGTAKSRAEIFESNGTRREDIFRHPDFVERYLRTFIFGPQLPPATIAGFCKIVEDDRGTSGMLLDQLKHFARSETRKWNLDRSDAASAFYLLAMETGHRFNARAIRDAAKSAK